MAIIPQLILNDNPRTIPSGSMVLTENMMLDKEGDMLQSEIGFNLAFEFDNDKFVGFISCDNCIIAFTKNDYIYKIEKDVYHSIPTGWHYSGGEERLTYITGTYIYNTNGELILAVSECYKDEENPGEPIPLKIINIDKAELYEDENKYLIAPDVPFANAKLVSKVKGCDIFNGIYTFYISYEIDKNRYTNWFQLGVPYYALHETYEPIIDHTYRNSKINGSDSYAINYTVGGTKISAYVNNPTKNSNEGFDIKVMITNYTFISTLYKRCRIAYIIKTENGEFGRLYKEYELNSTFNILFNTKKFIKEISIDELKQPVLNIFSPKCITSYDNKLYVSNFKESEYNVDFGPLQTFADMIRVYIGPTSVDNRRSEDITTQGNFFIESSYNNTKSNDNFSLKISKSTNAGNPIFWFDEYPDLFNYFVNITNNIKDKIDGRQPTPIDLDAITCFGLAFDCSVTDDLYTQGNGTLLVAGEFISARNCGIAVIKNSSTSGYALRLVTKTGHDLRAGEYKGQNYEDGMNSVGFYRLYQSPISFNIVNYQTGNIVTNPQLDTYSVRSLMPGNCYKFYAHYVRKDGSYTNGIPIYDYSPQDTYHEHKRDEIWCNWAVDSEGNHNPGYKYIVAFYNIVIPSPYVGIFFSYEEVNKSVLAYLYCIGENKFKALDIELALSSYKGKYLQYAYTDGSDESRLQYSIKEITNAYLIPSNTPGEGTKNTLGSDTIITFDSEDVLPYAAGDVVALLSSYNNYKQTNNIYKDTKTKVLYSLGPILYRFKSDGSGKLYVYAEVRDDTNYPDDGDNLGVYGCDFNYPEFLTKEPIITFDKHIHIAEPEYIPLEISNRVIDFEHFISGTYASLKTYYKYSYYNLDCISFKQKPEIVISTELAPGTRTSDKKDHLLLSTIVRPANLINLFEYPGTYIENKTEYTNNDDSYDYNNVLIIRRSDVLADESLINGWYNFRPSNYKVISKNKGKVHNIFGIGFNFYIHTNNNMLIFDGSPKLSSTAQLITKDIFEIEPTELFTSYHGFGGLQDYKSWCITEFGYFFFDADMNKLYNYDTEKLTDMSQDIEYLLNSKFTEARFLNDVPRSRLIICFFKDGEPAATISFNYKLKKFISLHNYYFKENLNTKNRCYLTEYDERIYEFDETELTNSPYKLTYRDIDFKCRVQFIFNPNYTIAKVINYLYYILSNVDNFRNKITLDAETLIHDDESLYSGDILRIYSDSCDSGFLDIKSTAINPSGDYKHPYYDKGRFNFNYFRNKLYKLPLREEDTNEIKDGNYMIRNSKLSDQESLIYGKYIIVEFRFTTFENHFKLEDVGITLNDY